MSQFQHRRARALIRLLAGTAVLAAPCAAWAQTAAAPKLEEVVVTARKVAERSQDAPISLSVVTSDDIEAAQIIDLNSLQRFTPGLSFYQQNERDYGQLFVRGMQTPNLTYDTTRELASMFIDGVYYVGSIPGISFDDVERIEFVKGPQSALFGRSTFSGALGFITKTPGQAVAGNVQVKAGTFNDYQVSGSLEGGLIADKLTGRISASVHDFGGDYRNSLDGSRMGATNDKSFAVTLYATPTANFRAKLRAMYQTQDDGPSSSQLLGRLAQHNCGPFNGTRNINDTAYCGKITFDRNRLAVNNQTVGLARQQVGSDFGLERAFYFGSADLQLDIGGGYTLASLTGLTREHNKLLNDLDRTGVDVWVNQRNRRERAVSQELRLTSPAGDRFHWLVGAYYLRQDHFNNNVFYAGANSPFGAGVSLGVNNVDRIVTNYAGFGSVSFDFTDTLSASLEARWQHDNVASRLDNGEKLDGANDAWLPRLIVNYKPSTDMTVYVNVAKGVRPTQVNANFTALSPANQAIVGRLFNVSRLVPPEEIWNYELGMKSEFFDRRARLNIAVFYADWRNKQVSVAPRVDLNGNGVIDFGAAPANREFLGNTVVPGGTSHVYGFDLDGAWIVTPNLQFEGSVSYAHNEIVTQLDQNYTRITGKPNAKGQQAPFVPEWTAAFAAEYRTRLNDSLELFTRADVSYRGTRYGDLVNLAETGASTKVNLKAGVETGGWKITGYVDNLFDDDTLESLSVDGDSASDPVAFGPIAYYASLPRRRQLGVILGYRF